MRLGLGMGLNKGQKTPIKEYINILTDGGHTFTVPRNVTLATMTVTSPRADDLIIGGTENAFYVDGVGWVGSLETLTPGTLYTYSSDPARTVTLSWLSGMTAPVQTYITSIKPTEFRANWLASANALSYEIDVSESATFDTFVTGYQRKVVSGLYCVVTGLSANTAYYVRVRALGVLGYSADSNVKTETTLGNVAFATYLATDYNVTQDLAEDDTDRAALQTLINTVAAAGGGEIVLTGFVFIPAASELTWANNVWIKGNGASTSGLIQDRLTNENTAGTLITLNNKKNAVFTDMLIRAYRPFNATASTAITGATFYNCTIRGSYDKATSGYGHIANTLTITNAADRDKACIINMYNCILNGYGDAAQPWVTGRSYTTTSYVTVAGVIYKCASNHTSSVWAAETANWTRTLSTWTLGVEYYTTDYVYKYNTVYKCTGTHTAGVTDGATFLADVQAGKWIESSLAALEGTGTMTLDGTAEFNMYDGGELAWSIVQANGTTYLTTATASKFYIDVDTMKAATITMGVDTDAYDNTNSGTKFAHAMMGYCITHSFSDYFYFTPTTGDWVKSAINTYTHTTGNTTPLISGFTPVIGETYTIKYTLSAAVASVSFGGKTDFGTSGTVNTTYKATTTDPLTITPISGNATAVTAHSIYSSAYYKADGDPWYADYLALVGRHTSTGTLKVGQLMPETQQRFPSYLAAASVKASIRVHCDCTLVINDSELVNPEEFIRCSFSADDTATVTLNNSRVGGVNTLHSGAVITFNNSSVYLDADRYGNPGYNPADIYDPDYSPQYGGGTHCIECTQFNSTIHYPTLDFKTGSSVIDMGDDVLNSYPLARQKKELEINDAYYVEGTGTPDNPTLAAGYHATWASESTAFAVGDLVLDTSKIYYCYIAHDKGASFAVEMAKGYWRILGGGNRTADGYLQLLHHNGTAWYRVFQTSAYMGGKCRNRGNPFVFVQAKILMDSTSSVVRHGACWAWSNISPSSTGNGVLYRGLISRPQLDSNWDGATFRNYGDDYGYMVLGTLAYMAQTPIVKNCTLILDQNCQYPILLNVAANDRDPETSGDNISIENLTITGYTPPASPMYAAAPFLSNEGYVKPAWASDEIDWIKQLFSTFTVNDRGTPVDVEAVI